MIIRKPTVTAENDEMCLAARIEIDSPIDVPDTVWFRVPRAYGELMSDRADAFLAGLLPSAMALGEKIVVKGTISPRLAHGVREYQYVQNAWWPNALSVVDVKYDSLSESPRTASNGAVAMTFSGGVDSFYSLWRHLPANEPLGDWRVTHGLIINGFDKDVDLDNTGKFDRLYGSYRPLMDRLGVELVPLRTNIRQFRIAAKRRSHGHQTLEAPLAACALALGGFFTRFLLPAATSYDYEALVPGGGHPITVHMFTTESTQVVADGLDATRCEKTVALTTWPETYSTLRVCFQPTRYNDETGLIENCGTCEKCVRTMIALDLVDALLKYRTFPKRLARRHIWKTPYADVGALLFYEENLLLAKSRGRRDRIFDLRLARLRSRIVSAWRNRLPGFLRRQHNVL